MYFQSFQNFLKRTAKRAPIPLRTVAEIAASTLVKVSPINILIRKLKPGFGPTKTIEFSYCYVGNVNLTATFKCKLHFVLELLS